MNYDNRRYGLTFLFALGLGLACGDSGGTEAGTGTCEPGEVAECACENGSQGEQVCAEDGASYGDCDCNASETGDEASTNGDGDGDSGDGDGDSGDGDGDSGDGDGDSGDGDGDSGDGDGDSGDGDSGDGDGDPVVLPVVEIWHPGDGETRPVNVPIPWTGNATDIEDGDLSAQIVWTSSLDGQFGMGANFQAPLTTVGEHVITAEVIDSDTNVGMASIMLTLEP